MADEPKVYDDIPRNQIALRKPEEAAALARRISGEIPPDELEFHCIICGQSKSLKFDQDEIDALRGDISRYAGPCWNADCNNGDPSTTLVPKKNLRDDNFSVSRMAQENRKKEARETAEVQAEVFGEKFMQAMSGGVKPAAAPEEPSRPRPPGQRDDLPDARDLKDRK